MESGKHENISCLRYSQGEPPVGGARSEAYSIPGDTTGMRLTLGFLGLV